MDAAEFHRTRTAPSWCSVTWPCFCAVALLSGCSGCNDQASDAEALPFGDTELVAAVPHGQGIPARWDLMLAEWDQQTGATHRLVEFDTDLGNQSPAKPLGLTSGADPSADSSAALCFFPITWLPDLAANGLLADIPPAQQTEHALNWLDFFSGLRSNVCSLEGRPVVVPIDCPVLVCYYRRDLLEQANLSPPKTWDDYQALLETLDDWAPGLTAVEPWSERFRATMFLARAVAYAKHPGNFSLFFDYETGEPLVDTQGFVKALESVEAALQHLSPQALQFDPADCRREFLAGRAALAIAFESARHANAQRQPESQTESGAVRSESVSVGFCRLPGVGEVFNAGTSTWETPPGEGVNHITLTAFAGLCAGVSASATPGESQAAWGLLTQITRNDLETAFPGRTKSPCRDAHLASAAPWTGPELNDGERFEFLDVVASSLRDSRVVAELPVPGRQQFRQALTDGLNDVLAGDAAAAVALQAVAGRWREITDSIGRETVLNGYRRSLGLSAQTPVGK